MWDIFEKQDKICALSGLPIEFETSQYGLWHGEGTASLDRIDSSKGYICGNVQWVHKDVNRMKQCFKEDRLLDLCKLIVEHNKVKS